MITGRIIIIGLAVIVLLIQFLPLSRTDGVIYDDDLTEACISNVANGDGGNYNDFVLPEYIIPGQQTTLISRFYTECKMFLSFPVCKYADFLTDILTPPPDKTV